MTRITATLTTSIGADQQSVMLGMLERLHRNLASIHKDYLQPCQSISYVEAGSRPTPWQLSEGLPPSHYLRGMIERYFQPSWELVTKGDERQSLQDTASAWILFFGGCLKLYVPDRPYDPALKPMVIRDRHGARRAELHAKLSALRQFEELTTGQSTNLRCLLVEKELEALGNEPAVEPVLRSKNSELSQLQGEFNNVLQSIVGRSPNHVGIARLFGEDLTIVQEVELLRSNITQAVSRLRQRFRTYDDVTKPLVAMLHGLDAGLAMAEIAKAPVDDAAESMEHICRYTPFFGMRPGNLAQDDLELIDEASPDSRFKYLESVAVMDSNHNLPGAATLTNVFKIIHGIYEGWKQQLSEDQRRDLAKSSMYRYRGGEADADANDNEAFNELFPDYEASDIHAATNDNPRLDPRMLAQRMARHHRNLLEDSKTTPVDRLLQLMRSSCADVARLWHHDSKSKSPVPAQDLLCGLILDLDENMDQLHRLSPASTPCNFYTDANLSEARKLVILVRRLQGRFFGLKQAWPEHATLDDVLRTSSDLLALRHTEPIAKLITKVEKLHGYVHEWQMVASREYSASASYEQLTSLIVDWRRLELTTWSRLFAMEDKRCEQEVNAWWFVAYEAIVAAPLSILESGDDLYGHSEELFVTLQGFVSSTSVGHFSLRLRLLETFRRYVVLIEQGIPGFGIVNHTLSNFLIFYSRYAAPIQQILQSGRVSLEKEMKDILLLASWKDTNVNALRDSAKRSHHKLFKVVRKYRTLLARPAQNIIDQGFPENPLTPASDSVVIRTRLHQPDTGALQALKDVSYRWSERPPRFRNISTTTANMVSMSQIHPSTTDIPSVLGQFIGDLSGDIKSLQKETPATATDDDAGPLKHLMSRKRKLLSDTLRHVRHMGFRTNLSGDVLSRQASTAIILSRLPPIEHLTNSDIYIAAEYYLHHFLDLMPAVRQASRTHSEDLSGAEVARSVGYLESMLLQVVKQRTLIGDFAERLSILDQMVNKVQNVWRPELYQVVEQSLDNDVAVGIKRSISRLSYIVDTGCLIIEKYGKLGKMDHSALCECLQKWNSKFRTVVVDLESEPTLPDGLTCSQQRLRRVEARELMENFRHDLQQQATINPGLAFVLRQIMLWTETSPQLPNGYQQEDNTLSVMDFDQRLLKTCDLVLVTMQNVEKTTSTVTSTEDANWFVNCEAALAKSVKTLHVDEIRTSLEEAMAMLHRLSQQGLMTATALTTMALPIINQYRDICHNILNHVATKSKALNNLAATLAKSFTEIASRGFCNPSKPSAAEAGKNEKLEEGTGLGEGEGAEDISKDIQDDEDLTELAQEGQKSGEGEEIEDQEDAVNMDQDELEGELGDAPERDDNGDEASEAGGDDEGLDEETGDVDDLDPNAVDEKLWDDDQKQSGKDKEGTKPKGAGQKDDQPNAESDQKGDDDGAAEEEEALSDTGAEEGEEVAKGEAEMMDPHAQQEENLDLPDEMDLDGQEKSPIASDIEDSDLDGLSDFDSEEDQHAKGTISENEGDEEGASREDQAVLHEQADAETEQSDVDQVDEAGSPVDTDPEADSDTDEGLLQNRSDDATIDENNIAPSDAQGLKGQDTHETTDTQMQESKAAGSTGAANENANAERSQAPAKEGELSNLQDRSNDASESRGSTQEDYTSQAFKKLGDALEKWHRQQRQIQAAQSSPPQEQITDDVDMMDPEFQHLEDEDAKADTQAWGAATEDEAHTLDQRVLDSEMQDQPRDFLPDEAEAEAEADKNQDEDMVMEEANMQEPEKAKFQQQSKPSTFIGLPFHHHPTDDPQSNPLSSDIEDSPVQDPANPLQTTSPHHLPRSLPSAQALWSHHSSTTLPLSHTLTEQLRLILSPTLATKLRGDFRTGKRLNIKKIIPYIASGYKRDKIWMRRSVPSARNYQIMLAIDDSKSMGEAGSADLAFETLALVATSLSMLEVGQISILAFGHDVTVAHAFDQPWSGPDAGVNVFRHFGFNQGRTDVKGLLVESLRLFRDARASSSRAANAVEIWQLQFIVSDGVCEDHGSIRRLVRQAQEERIMIVFVIVDRIGRGRGEDGEGEGASIVDMNEAVFEGEGEERKLVLKRYLDGFPFGYYIVVGDVRELPAVLGQALRGWFGEVVGGGR